MNLHEYKELTVIFHCEPFIRLKNESVLFKDYPDNELIYVIMDGLLKSYNVDTDLEDAIQNAIQFTSIADCAFYRSEKDMVIKFLANIANLYRPIIEKNITKFSEVTNTFTKLELKKNYILVNVCGKRNENYGKIHTSSLSKPNANIEITTDVYGESFLHR